MISKLEERGIKVSALYYCPHINQDNCPCKKPKDGMFRRAALELNINLQKSIMIGEQTHDVQAGLAAGVGSNFIVTTGIYKTKSGKYELPEDLEGKVVVCNNLSEVGGKITKADIFATFPDMI
jgi:histidinol phosphatase-like enzyme